MYTENLDYLLNQEVTLCDKKETLLLFGHDKMMVYGNYEHFIDELTEDAILDLLTLQEVSKNNKEYYFHLDLANLKTAIVLKGDTEDADRYLNKHSTFFAPDYSDNQEEFIERINIIRNVLHKFPETQNIVKRKILKQEN